MAASHFPSLLQHLDAGAASAAELQAATGQSQSTVARTLRALQSRRRVLRMGTTRGARYALLHPVADIGAQWPLRRVAPDGSILALGILHALAAGQFHFEPASATFAWGGLTAGLPYFLQDQRPAGFLGRTIPQRYPELGLPQRVADWSDAHYLRYLTRRGGDAVGDLILGDEAFDGFLAAQRQLAGIPLDARAIRYPLLASEVLAGRLPGSSAHGEHPKFATLLRDGGERHVLVKFSPPVTTAVGQRWSDLLVAEHLAHQVLAQDGVPAARSRIEHFGERTFLEMDRFDRAGSHGRVGVTSLLAIDTHLHGRLDSWIAASTRLHAAGRLDDQSLAHARLLDTFGALIANTDRHFGNLAFFDRYDGRFTIAPAYDMLPMRFAPEHDQVLVRDFTPPAPSADTLEAYGRARALAEHYWQACASDARISGEFRALCADCAAQLAALPRTGAYIHQPAAHLQAPASTASTRSGSSG